MAVIFQQKAEGKPGGEESTKQSSISKLFHGRIPFTTYTQARGLLPEKPQNDDQWLLPSPSAA